MHYGTRILVLLAVVILLVIGDSPAAVVQDAPSVPSSPYSIVELDTLGGESTRAYSINDRGWVAGHMYDADSRQRAVLWKGGATIDLGTLGGDEAAALNVNELGQVVGASATVLGAALWDPGTHAFLWVAGRMQDLGTLGGQVSVAQDVNEHGQVVGTSTTTAGQSIDTFADGQHAFLWEDGSMKDLGTLGGERSAAFAVNDAGQVVGTAQTADGEDHAFLWEDGHMTDLGMLGGHQAIAFAINRHGQVVGGSTTTDGQDFSEIGTMAFRWEDGDLTALGDTSGLEGIAYAINDRGGVVGNDLEVGAVLWRGEEAVALTRLLPEGVRWESLDIARAINRRGQIVGWGQRDGSTRAFIAYPATSGIAPAEGLRGSTPTAYVVGLEAAEVVERAQRAIQNAGTYRFQIFAINEVDGDPIRLGEVEIGRGDKSSAADGSDLEYFDGQRLYMLRSNGEWLARVPSINENESLVDFLDSSPAEWELAGMESVKGRTSYVIAQISQETESFTSTHKLWIDAMTFLPQKQTWLTELDGMEPFGNETMYTDFGAPVDVIPPAAALAPTPTPEPLPETSGGRVTIALHDIYYEPHEVTIPANEDVLIVLPNKGATVHNFSIEEVGINSGDVEWGTTGHVVVNLPPGVYEFRCTIPGHTEAGQVGTLIVRE